MGRFLAKLTRALWLKRLVNTTGQVLQKRAPRIHEKMFVPLKIRAKKFVLSGFQGKRRPPESSGTHLWNPILSSSVPAAPLVSIIVPCYNHAAYLEERLESVYGQSYQNFEVLLLDDESTDESRSILESWREKYPGKTRTCFNEQNCGSVFGQWQKGMELAKGELIWIAESDDCCDPDFLEKLVPAFRDEAVMLAFCRSDFMQQGERINTTEFYLKELDAFDWSASFYVTAGQLVEHAFSMLNVIPNVSSSLFRRPVTLSEELLSMWKDMKLCGDWVFYLECIKGGCVFYCHETTNYYRVHGESTSLKVQQQMRYYREHEAVSRYLERNYRLPESVHLHHRELLLEHYETFCPDEKAESLAEYFSLDRIHEERNSHIPSVLMAVFSMSVGGGETFPIVLANELKRQGIPIAVADFRMGEFNRGVRAMLRADIPYIPLCDAALLPGIVRDLGIDVIHSHHATVDEAVSYAMKDISSAAHHVITLHGMYESKEPAYQKSIIRQVFPSCDAFVYIADKNLLPFQDAGIKDFGKFHKIGNGLPYSKGNPIARAELGIPEDAFVLCLVSRAIPEKGWQLAADAVMEANRRCAREIHLMLVGSGEMHDRMKGNVPDYVHLMGFRSNVRDYFATADAGLLPSEFAGESFPLVIIDCLYCERPVIATDIGEVRNQLMTPDGKHAGIVLSLHDGHLAVEELTNAVCSLAEDPRMYEKVKCRCKAAANKFLIHRIAEAYGKIYKGIS